MIKKPGSDKNILQNYRPISQLTAFSKLLERIVSTQIFSHLLAAKVLHPHQSAYMPGLSTETALSRINDDVLNNKTGSLMFRFICCLRYAQPQDSYTKANRELIFWESFRLVKIVHL